MQLPRTPTVDANLLAALDRAFRRVAGKDARINVKELQNALGLRSEYLARRVFAAFDLNGNGSIEREEFLEGVRKLLLGTDRDKLLFAFRVHDHDGDGAISREELCRMIAISIAESEVTERPTQPADKLASVLFHAADKNGDGRISFDEFAATVETYPDVLRKLTRSEAQWILPNEDILEQLEHPERRSFLRRVLPARENGWAPTLVFLSWLVANVALFTTSFLAGRGPETTNDLMQAGRALGVCISFDAALVLVPVMRRLLTRVRASFLGRALPIDHAVAAHRILGYALVALGAGHVAVVLGSFALGHPSASLGRYLLASERGATGLLLTLVLLVMWVFALPFVRRSRHFELFYSTHLLYVVWFAAAIAHAPRFLLFAGVPLLVFAVEQIVRLARRGTRTVVLEAEALRSGVTRVELSPPPGFTWRPGDYAFLRLPAIAKREWHPFTISSAPESGRLVFHVRSLGNWTAALRRRVEQDETSGAGGEPLTAFLDGPYGAPSTHVFESRFAVFIGAGIGVTPFASVLESLVRRASGEAPPKLEKAHFFWLNKDQYSFEWFAALLVELEKTDARGLLDIHLCMTQGRSGATALGLEVARQVFHAAGRSDLITGLRTHTHMGNPDWADMLGRIKSQHAPNAVDVFFCGPPGLAGKIRPVCARLGLAFREEQF